MTYDLWVAYDVRIGQLLDGTIAYFAMSIEIGFVWWELACDEQLCLMRSSFTLLWDDYLLDYYGAFGVRFGARFQRVDVVISDGHRYSILIIWGFESTMFETMVAGWVAFILVSSLLPLLTSRPLLALWASHEHHNIFFLIALLTFYIENRGPLVYISFIRESHEPLIYWHISSLLLLLLFCLTTIFHHTLLFISFVLSFVFVITFLSMPWVMIFLVSVHGGRSCPLPFLFHGHRLGDP